MSIDTHTTDHRPDPAEQVTGIPTAVDAPFVARHLGPRDEDVAAMLSVIGKDSLDDLIATTLPSAIRTDRPLGIESAPSEQEVLTVDSRLASLNTAGEEQEQSRCANEC